MVIRVLDVFIESICFGGLVTIMSKNSKKQEHGGCRIIARVDWFSDDHKRRRWMRVGEFPSGLRVVYGEYVKNGRVHDATHVRVRLHIEPQKTEVPDEHATIKAICRAAEALDDRNLSSRCIADLLKAGQ
jgi:hypothetical protein